MHLSTATIIAFLAKAAMTAPYHEQEQISFNSKSITTSDPDSKYEYYDYYKANANSGIYLCEHIRFSGHCIHYTNPFGQCTTIVDQFPPGDHSVSSAGADLGNWCTLYSEENCHGQELQVHYPGFEDLTYLGWNDKVRSYNCAAE
ncbi:hypothetical protein BDV06DRAFT_196716 [Aspergillus oleicola]